MRYSLKELEALTQELAKTMGYPTEPGAPGGLIFRTRDSRVGGCEVLKRGPEGRGWDGFGIGGTRGEVGAQLTIAIRIARETRATLNPTPRT